MENAKQKSANKEVGTIKYAYTDEFIGLTKSESSLADIIETKIRILYDFCILTGSRKHKDFREPIVRKLLEEQKTPTRIDAALHRVVRFEMSIDEFIKAEGGDRYVY